MKASSPALLYVPNMTTFEAASRAGLATVCGPIGRTQLAESQELGIRNSDQPHSRHARTSGEGVIGGWVSVREVLRYNRISAGMTEREPDWHFGHIMQIPRPRNETNQAKKSTAWSIPTLPETTSFPQLKTLQWLLMENLLSCELSQKLRCSRIESKEPHTPNLIAPG